jgi:DNA polymerase IIIc chi subunit
MNIEQFDTTTTINTNINMDIDICDNGNLNNNDTLFYVSVEPSAPPMTEEVYKEYLNNIEHQKENPSKARKQFHEYRTDNKEYSLHTTLNPFQ